MNCKPGQWAIKVKFAPNEDKRPSPYVIQVGEVVQCIELVSDRYHPTRSRGIGNVRRPPGNWWHVSRRGEMYADHPIYGKGLWCAEDSCLRPLVDDNPDEGKELYEPSPTKEKDNVQEDSGVLSS